MNKITCPLCNSINISLVEKINTKDIEKAYLYLLNVVTKFSFKEIKYMTCSNCNIGFFDPMATGGEELYEQLQKFEWYYMTNKPEYILAKKYVPCNGKILEVGSGKAAFSEIVGKDRYVGLEFNNEAIKSAKSIGINLIKESIEQFAIENTNKYDAVVSFQVLEHVSNPSSFIQGCIDSLKKGGRLILAVPNHNGICGLAQNSILDIPPHHVTHWTEKTMKYIAIQFNLDLVAVDCEAVSNNHLLWAAHSIYSENIRNIFGIDKKLFDTRLSAKIIKKCSSILTKLIPCNINLVKGHTVLACYSKK